MLISLSILDYEPDLAAHLNNISESRSMSSISSLIETKTIERVHVDVMKPPMIPDKTTFPINLLRAVYENLKCSIPLAAHLMVNNPYPLIDDICSFMPKKERDDFVVFIQRESFASEEETISALEFLKKCNFSSGICLNLSTPTDLLTKDIIEISDIVLIMTVMMGAGGQNCNEEGLRRTALFSKMFPNKKIAVDGGINSKTIVEAKKAGAKIAVVGSFITRNKDPVKAVFELMQSLSTIDS
ncbi:MAG: hypothetical protein QW279_13125 [Candidatus Jordarchaeaceae archaeon]